MTQDKDRAEPWVLLMRPWHPHTGDSATTHHSRDQAMAQAREFLLENRRQTAYVCRATKVMGIKKSDLALLVVEMTACEGGDAWRDIYHPDWPGTSPPTKPRELGDD